MQTIKLIKLLILLGKILFCNTIMNPQQFYDNRIEANIDSLNNVLSYTQ